MFIGMETHPLSLVNTELCECSSVAVVFTSLAVLCVSCDYQKIVRTHVGNLCYRRKALCVMFFM